MNVITYLPYTMRGNHEGITEEKLKDLLSDIQQIIDNDDVEQ